MKSERLIQAFFYNNPDNYPPVINGMRLLSEAGWKVQLFCRDDGKQWNVRYPTETLVERIRPSSNSWLSYLSFVKKAWRRGSKDASVFVAHDMHALLPARILATRYRRPLVYHCYDYSGNGYKQTLGGQIMQAFQFGFARTASITTVPDEGLAEIVHKELHLRKRPLVVVNSPISAPPENGGALRQALSNRGVEFEKILFRQGRVGPGHAIEATIRSIPLWANRKWGFVVMGITESSYVNSLIELAASLGVERQFVVLPPVSYDEVHQFTVDADVGHALYEPIHINNLNISGACKIQEYMAAGLPILASNRPALRSLAEKYKSGLTADEESPESIAGAVNALLDSEQLLDRMGRAGRQAFDEVYCYERQFSPVIDALRNLTNGARKGGGIQ